LQWLPNGLPNDVTIFAPNARTYHVPNRHRRPNCLPNQATFTSSIAFPNRQAIRDTID